MRGQIVKYKRKKGLISGEDGKRYQFTKKDWKGGKPIPGCKVDFEIEDNKAVDVYPLQKEKVHVKEKKASGLETLIFLILFFILLAALGGV